MRQRLFEGEGGGGGGGVCVLDGEWSGLDCRASVLSKHPSPSKNPPPIFDDPMVRVYIHYTHVHTNGFSV